MTFKLSNQLIESISKMGVEEWRLLSLVFSKIRQEKEQNKYGYSVTPQEMKEFRSSIGLSGNTHHKLLRQTSKKLMTCDDFMLEISSYNEDTRENRNVHIRWFEESSYPTKDDTSLKYVTVKFSRPIEPLIFNLKENYTLVDLRSISKLDSSFSMRLYLWLCEYQNLREYKVAGTVSFTISISELRERSGLKGKSDDYRVFRRYTLEPALTKINAHTNFSVIATPKLTGRKVTHIIFNYVDEKKGFKKIDNSIPARPRLPQHPKVISASHEQAVWAKDCLKLLLKYQSDLRVINKEIPTQDMRKMKKYYLILGNRVSAKHIEIELNARQIKQEMRKKAPSI